MGLELSLITEYFVSIVGILHPIKHFYPRCFSIAIFIA
jgi:hypothetical protein